MATEEMEASGVLVDSVDSRILLATGDKVFADMKNLGETRVGERFTIFAGAAGRGRPPHRESKWAYW